MGPGYLRLGCLHRPAALANMLHTKLCRGMAYPGEGLSCLQVAALLPLFVGALLPAGVLGRGRAGFSPEPAVVMVMDGPRAQERQLQEEFLRGGFRGAEELKYRHASPRLTEALSEQSMQRVAGEGTADPTGCLSQAVLQTAGILSVWRDACKAEQQEAAVVLLPSAATT